MSKRWIIRKHDANAVNALAAELRVLPLVAALLISRGYDTKEKAERFLDPTLISAELRLFFSVVPTRYQKCGNERQNAQFGG